jgi:hypothetical protein
MCSDVYYTNVCFVLLISTGFRALDIQFSPAVHCGELPHIQISRRIELCISNDAPQCMCKSWPPPQFSYSWDILRCDIPVVYCSQCTISESVFRREQTNYRKQHASHPTSDVEQPAITPQTTRTPHHTTHQ